MNHTAGVQYDNRGGRNRLLVCSAILPPPFGAGGQAGGVLDIDVSTATPSLTAFYDTSPAGPGASIRFCNDIIADNAGNIYATDSFGSQVWKITTGGVVSTYISNSAWNDASFGLDGIEMTSDGNLIVSHITHSELWLVKTTAPPTSAKITITGNSISMNPDGILFGQHGCLYTVGNGHVFRLASYNNWTDATVLETVAVTCTTPTAIAWDSADSAYFVSCANNFGSGPYAIEKITFSAAETDTLCTVNPGSSTPQLLCPHCWSQS